MGSTYNDHATGLFSPTAKWPHLISNMRHSIVNCYVSKLLFSMGTLAYRHWSKVTILTLVRILEGAGVQ